MKPEPELVELLANSDVRVLAFDPLGASSVPIPGPLLPVAATVVDGDSPLDRIEAESQGRAVVAFEHARRHRRGAAMVTMVGDAEQSWLEIFDLEEEHGCFLAVISAERPPTTDDRDAAKLAPRQCGYDMNVTGVIQAITPDFTAMLGWDVQAAVGKSSLDFIHPDDHEVGIVGWVELLEHPGGQVRLRQRLRTAAGEWLWCELTDTNLLEDRDHRCVRSEIVDVSREMAAQAALQRRETLLDRLHRALPTGVLQLDAEGQVVNRNDRWTTLTGLSEQDGIEALLGCLVDRSAVEHCVSLAVEQGQDADLAVVLDGRGLCRYGELHLRPLLEDGDHVGLLITLDDVSKLRAYQMELTEQARRDALTGVYNRLGIEELLVSRLADPSVKVLFLDLDRFKAINDEHGHVVGDQVLRLVAECVSDVIRPADRLGRLGGDEFLVILSPETGSDEADAIARRIGDAVPTLAARLNETLNVGVSVGLAESRGGDDFDSLIKRADGAMYEVKQRRTVESS